MSASPQTLIPVDRWPRIRRHFARVLGARGLAEGRSAAEVDEAVDAAFRAVTGDLLAAYRTQLAAAAGGHIPDAALDAIQTSNRYPHGTAGYFGFNDGVDSTWQAGLAAGAAASLDLVSELRALLDETLNSLHDPASYPAWRKRAEQTLARRLPGEELEITEPADETEDPAGLPSAENRAAIYEAHLQRAHITIVWLGRHLNGHITLIDNDGFRIAHPVDGAAYCTWDGLSDTGEPWWDTRRSGDECEYCVQVAALKGS